MPVGESGGLDIAETTDNGGCSDDEQSISDLLAALDLD